MSYSKVLAANYRVALRAALQKEYVGKSVSVIPSGHLVIDAEVMLRNLNSMRRYVEEISSGGRPMLLRTHGKMHKSVGLAKLQMREGGAVGICVQKVSEAEVFTGMHCDVLSPEEKANTFIPNVFVSNEASRLDTVRRIFALRRSMIATFGSAASLSLCVDSIQGLEMIQTVLSEEEEESKGTTTTTTTTRGEEGCAPLGILVEVDIGQGRGGAKPTPEVLQPFVQRLKELLRVSTRDTGRSPPIAFRGLHCYHGAAQHIRDLDERARVMQVAYQSVVAAKEIFAKEELPVTFVTGAGTGTFHLEATSQLYHELQPGSYLVMDVDYRLNFDKEQQQKRKTKNDLSSSSSPPLSSTQLLSPSVPTFENALFLKSAVASVQDGLQLTLDVGHKSSAIDCGTPCLHWQNPCGTCCWIRTVNGGDDHCMLRAGASDVHYHAEGDMKDDEKQSIVLDVVRSHEVGQTVWLTPGHCDPTFNLHDYFFVVQRKGTSMDDAVITDVMLVDARGCQQ